MSFTILSVAHATNRINLLTFKKHKITLVRFKKHFTTAAHYKKCLNFIVFFQKIFTFGYENVPLLFYFWLLFHHLHNCSILFFHNISILKEFSRHFKKRSLSFEMHTHVFFCLSLFQLKKSTSFLH